MSDIYIDPEERNKANPDERDILEDTATRLERNIDQQINSLNDIDDKAQYTARLVTWLTGIILTLLSIGVKSDSIQMASISLPAKTSFILGILSFLLSLVFAIITYLVSKFRTGIHQEIGQELKESDTILPRASDHLRVVLDAYSYCIEVNREVLDKNSQRFRVSLVSLIGGISFTSTSVILTLLFQEKCYQWIVLGISAVLFATVTCYILTGSYLVHRRN